MGTTKFYVPGPNHAAQPQRGLPHAARAFTLVDVLLTVLILGIASAIGFDAIAESEANFRADRAARETITALRYARTLALTTGNPSGVEFDNTLRLVRVYSMINNVQTWVTNPLSGGGSNLYQIDLSNTREVAGVAMVVNIPTDATNPYDCQISPLGSTSNIGTITYSFGRGRRVVTITALGEPTLN